MSLAFFAALRWLRALPWQVWAVVVALGVSVALLLAHRSAVSDAYAKGRADALAQAATVAPVYIDRVVRATAKTDTVMRRVVQRVATVDTLILRVPDDVRTRFPVVDTALKACTALAQDCATLRADVLTERIARDSLTVAIGAITVAKADTIRTLKRRPTRMQAAIYALAAGAAGFLLGHR